MIAGSTGSLRMPATLAVGVVKGSMPALFRRGLRTAVERYEYANARHPVLVRGGIGIGLFAFGDYIAQRLDHSVSTSNGNGARGIVSERFAWDPERAFRSSSWRAVVWAPIATGFWHLLDKKVRAGGVRGAVIKIAADLATLNLLMTYSFIAWSKAWCNVQRNEPVSAKDVVEFTNDRFPVTVARSYAFWFPLHCITYGVVPSRHRLVWVSVCSIGFAALLSVGASDCVHCTPKLSSISVSVEMPTSSNDQRLPTCQAGTPIMPASAPPPPPGCAPPPPSEQSSTREM